MNLYFLKKIITPFLLLPGLFVFFFLAVGLRSLLRGRSARALVLLLVAAMLWLPAIPPVADKLLRTLESGLTIPEDPKGDVIIMMGGAVYEGSPDLSGIGIPSRGSWERIVTVVRLQRRLGVPVILSGGQVHPERAPMGPIYRRLLTDLGVPQDLILVEDKSRDTLENAQFSKALCQARGFQRPIVVTSALHIRRTQLSFEKAGLAALFYPAGFRTWENKTYIWPDFLPQSYDPFSEALHEYLGLLAYRFLY
ncbi:MAG: YdcF family protein [Desulfobacterales bacterium]